ncbi:DHHC zinc finger membrane protein [Paecilomyces variotii No. 5]|uniref:DHHC zinc finger membrane protein n=1 Tax=Byssochlamys spectabilis (strain No. 5 / NBRC 109023) TaxID=1356009 RepID=V5G6D8_BYSSN|nr:DHHC zinc finger membrane protein [Paecilomyces variotii No. 5]
MGRWSKNVGWSAFFNLWASVILGEIRIGAIFLLALMTAPLAVGFFLYHVYLIWAGMTTNENAKWEYWRDDIEDGLVFKAKRSEIYGEHGPENESPAPRTFWPAHSDQLLAITDGEPPKVGHMLSSRSNSVIQPDEPTAPIDSRWIRISSLADVENIYDLGFWGNLQDVLKLL